jgi:hypothetical protein
MKGFNPIPKPEKKRKAKPPCNGYKDKPNRVCFYEDHERGAERHEVFGGSNRRNSIEDGFQVDVCMKHHKELQDNITDWAQKENKKWKVHFQKIFEGWKLEEGMTPLEARFAFKERYGKSHLPFTEVE